MSPTVVPGAELLRPEILAAGSGDAAGSADGTRADHGAGSPIPERGTLKTGIETLERQVLRETLLRHDWNKSRAAE